MPNSIAAFVSNPVTIVMVATGMLAWAGLSYRNLWRGSDRLGVAVRTARDLLRAAGNDAAFLQHFEAVSAKLAEDPLLGVR
jgi:hypothetical protein